MIRYFRNGFCIGVGGEKWTCAETGSCVTLKAYLGKWITTWEVSGEKMIGVRNRIVEKVRHGYYRLDYFFSCVTRFSIRNCWIGSRSYADLMICKPNTTYEAQSKTKGGL